MISKQTYEKIKETGNSTIKFSSSLLSISRSKSLKLAFLSRSSSKILSEEDLLAKISRKEVCTITYAYRDNATRH